MIIQKNAEFFKSMTAPSVSKPIPNGTADTLSLQISGNFSSGKFHVEGRNNKGGDWVSLAAINLSDFMPVKGGFTKAGLYEVGIVGVRELRGRVESVSGEVSMFGQLISTEET